MSDMIDRLNAALEGRYQIDREVGEGGMATVYLADDLRHERRVALKVLKPELAAVVGADRFLAEIKTTANLRGAQSGTKKEVVFPMTPVRPTRGLLSCVPLLAACVPSTATSEFCTDALADVEAFMSKDELHALMRGHGSETPNGLGQGLRGDRIERARFRYSLRTEGVLKTEARMHLAARLSRILLSQNSGLKIHSPLPVSVR